WRTAARTAMRRAAAPRGDSRARGMRRDAPPIPRCAPLLRDGLARAAELGGEVSQLGKAVLHAQDSLRIIDVNTGFEGEARDGRGVDVDELHHRVFGQQVTAASEAPLAVAALGLVEDADVPFSPGDLHCLRLPEGERVQRAR